MNQQQKNERRARAFHADHPVVWELFCRYSLQVIGRGFEQYSANNIMGRIRFETDQPGNVATGFKIDARLACYYARWFMAVYPEYDGFYRLRRLRTADRPAGNDEYGPAQADLGFITEVGPPPDSMARL